MIGVIQNIMVHELSGERRLFADVKDAKFKGADVVADNIKVYAVGQDRFLVGLRAIHGQAVYAVTIRQGGGDLMTLGDVAAIGQNGSQYLVMERDLSML